MAPSFSTSTLSATKKMPLLYDRPRAGRRPGGHAVTGPKAVRRSATLLPTARPRGHSRAALAALAAAALTGSAGLVGSITNDADAALGASAPLPVTRGVDTLASPPISVDFARHVAALGVASGLQAPPAESARAVASSAPAVAPVAPPVAVHVPAAVGPSFSGVASWYGGRREDGRRTASGVRFSSGAMTTASRALPMGTRLRVCRAQACVTVVVNDRGPYVGGRILDLSRAAAGQLGMLAAGVGYVTATRLS